MRSFVLCLTAVSLMVAAACNNPDAINAGSDTAAGPAASGAKIDSLIPVEESLRRFREGLPVVTALYHGAPSLDSLVAAVRGALDRGDTVALAALAITRAEYAYLYYPTSVYSSKPYELAPDIAWLLSGQSSDKGRRRLVQRLGGRELRSAGYKCGASSTEGENRILKDCAVTYVDPATSTRVTRRLFGAVVERDGRFKLLSFANDF